jgi:hypothetical protein
MEPTSRDTLAGLKLLGGLIRLDVLHPSGFTAAQLADHARVDAETARAYLNPEKGPGYAEVIPGAKASAGADGSRGRPANLYRLRSDRRAALMQRLAEMRRELDGAAAAPEPPAEQLFAPLDLLEATVEQLERRADPPEIWIDRLGEARLELGGVSADLRALQAKASPAAKQYARRLKLLKARLVTAELAGPPQFAENDPIHNLVAKFGQWMNGVPAAFEPVLVLLDGIRGNDPVSTVLVESCGTAQVHVAAFDVASMKAPRRAALYAMLDRLRVATPLAVCDFVLTVDGHTKIANKLAAEFCALGQPGTWQTRAPAADTESAALNVGALRSFYLEQSKTILDGWAATAHTVFATHLASTLSAFAIVDAKEIRHLPLVDAQQHKARWRNAAHELMGNVVCLDTTHNRTIEATCAGTVDYVAQATNSLQEMQTNILRRSYLFHY